MSIKKVKSKHSKKHIKSKSQSKSQSTTHSFPNKHQSILDIINKLSSSKYNNHTKSQNNLPARLMRMSSSRQSQVKQPQVFSKSFSSSSAVSSFSSVMKNGKVQTHSKGKEVINNSNKPFIEIKEMDNGNIKHYMVPKTSIPYKSKTKSNPMMLSNLNINSSKKSTKSKTSKKSTKSKKSKKSTKSTKSTKSKKSKKSTKSHKSKKSKTTKKGKSSK